MYTLTNNASFKAKSTFSTPEKQINQLLQQFTFLKSKIKVKNAEEEEKADRNKQQSSIAKMTYWNQSKQSGHLTEQEESIKNFLEEKEPDCTHMSMDSLKINNMLNFNKQVIDRSNSKFIASSKIIIQETFSEIFNRFDFLIATIISKISFLNTKMQLFDEALLCYIQIKEKSRDETRSAQLTQQFVFQVSKIEEKYEQYIKDIKKQYEEQICSLKLQIHDKNIELEHTKQRFNKIKKQLLFEGQSERNQRPPSQRSVGLSFQEIKEYGNR